MPIYEFVCEACGARFEDLVAAGVESVGCPACESSRTRRVYSPHAAPPKLVKPPRGMRKQERANARLRARTKERFKRDRARGRAKRGRGGGEAGA